MAAAPRYVASRGGVGHLLCTFKGAVYAVPFDPDKLETQGSAVPILSDAQISPTTRAKYDVSLTGTLIYQKGSGTTDEGALSTIQWIDPSGKMEPLLAKPGTYGSVRVSPDGKRLAMTVRDGRGAAGGARGRVPAKLLRRATAQSVGRKIASYAANGGTPS